MSDQLCACGCGGAVEPNPRGRPKRFIKGHNIPPTKREKFLVTIHGSKGETFHKTVNARTNVEAAKRAMTNVPLSVFTEKIVVNDEVLYPNEDVNGRTGERGRPYVFLRTSVPYSVSINTARLVRQHVEDRKQGEFVDAAIRAKLKKDFKVEWD